VNASSLGIYLGCSVAGCSSHYWFRDMNAFHCIFWDMNATGMVPDNKIRHRTSATSWQSMSLTCWCLARQFKPSSITNHSCSATRPCFCPNWHPDACKTVSQNNKGMLKKGFYYSLNLWFFNLSAFAWPPTQKLSARERPHVLCKADGSGRQLGCVLGFRGRRALLPSHGNR
jgi:hypothetical protein